MQLITDVQKRAQQFFQENASTILTAGGVVGTVTTAVLAGRAGYRFHEIVEGEYRSRSMNYQDKDAPRLSKTDQLKLAGLVVIPPVLTGGVTVTSIIMANRMSAQKAAALAAAYGLAEGRLSEYKEKVAEKLTPAKEQKIQDELAQESVNKTPGSGQIVVVEGEVLCFDRPTGRYFRSTMEKIKQALNATTAEILHHEYASATHFYEELELPGTTWTDDVGWNRDQLPDLTFSTVLSEDNRPCIAIDFKVLPTADFIPKYY